MVKYALAAAALPVTLVTFAGELQGDARLLRWSTENENRLSRYELQRALAPNGNFATVFTTTPANLASNNYSFRDGELLTSQVVYYRLKIVDADGKITYSIIVPLALERDQLQITLYPNPAHSQLRILLTQATSEANIIIYDLSGRAVQRTGNLNGNLLQLNIAKLPAGTYYLKLHSAGSERMFHFIKQ